MFLQLLKKKSYPLLLSFAFLLLGSLFIFLKNKQPEPLSRTDFVLGTVATITLYDHPSETTLNLAMEKLTELENLLSMNKKGTLIDTINASAGVQPVCVDNATYALIEKALHYSELTQGHFDITIGPLVKLWHIGFPDAKVPTAKEIQSLLPLVDFHQVQLDAKNHSIFLKQSGMSLDLGSIGKGYAADEVAKVLKANGVNHAIINLGGNIYALGNKPDGSPWSIGVQDPFNPRGETLGILHTGNQSIVTSGIYERFIEDDKKNKYHHLLSPQTGYPFNNELAGVTIVSATSTDGDALSTSVFGLGLTEGIALVESLEHVEAIFITLDAKVYVTTGLKFQFELTNPDFTLVQTARS